MLFWAICTGLAFIGLFVSVGLALTARGRAPHPDEAKTLLDEPMTYKHQIELRRTASYFWPEIHQAWQDKHWPVLRPVGLMMFSVIGLPLFGGITLCHWSGSLRAFGVLLIVLALGFAIQIVRWGRGSG